jgi:hypothetical protein
VILDHVLDELPVEMITGQSRQLRVHRGLLDSE